MIRKSLRFNDVVNQGQDTNAGSGVNSGPDPNAARRGLRRLLASHDPRPDAARGRLLLEPLEARQLMAGDVEFLSTANDHPTTYADPAALFDASGLTAEGEAANDLVAFAKALDEAGVTFFGAAWCPFCTQQKQLFEDGADFLPFVEVTNPDRTLNSIGQAEGIQTFPTWDFPDGSRATGVLSLAEIAQRSGIAIPQGETPSFAPIGNVNVEVGSPLHIPIDAYDPDDTNLTVTVSVANPSLLQATVLQNNRSARVSVENWGDMVFELFEDRVPRATGRFVDLSQSGFYEKTADNEIIFHRVIDNFVLQTGDPTRTGSGGSDLGDFDDQFHPDLQHNRTGILSYAKSLDDTNDSQVFITEGQQRHLDYNHSIIGQLVEGDAVREAISETAVSNSRPTTDIVVSDIEIFQDTENAVVMLKATGASLGQTDVTITVTDGDGNSFSQVITVTVVADQENAQPYLADIAPVTTAAGVPAVFTVQGIDVEGDPIVYEARVIDNSGATATVNQSTGQVTVTPAASFSGQILVEVAARSSTTATSTNPSTRSSTMDLQTVAVNVGPAAPTAVTLNTASDSGLSNSDGVTNIAPITFTVTGVQPGASVEILAGDTQIGIATATSTTATVTTNNFAALGNTTSIVTARQTVNGVTSPKSSAINITYDTVAPSDVPAIPAQANVGTVYSANLESSEEGSGLRYALVSGPTGLTVNDQTGLITWTPTSEQAGNQSIVVRMTDLAGNSREQTFSVNVGTEAVVQIRLETTDLNNNPITSISPGQEFKIRVFANDLRLFGEAQGVFAVYTDLLFNADLAEPVTPGTFEYESLYNSGTSGTIGDGIIDEVGAFASQTSFVGPGEKAIFSVRMRALAGGTLTISADPAEGSGREIAIFNQDDAVPNNRVIYGSTTLQISANFNAVNDSATVSEDSTANSIPVLANDTVLVSGTTLSIGSAQSTSAQGGTVSVSGSNLLYTPAANFVGTDTFTYVAQDQTGSQNTATVTVVVQGVNDPPTVVNDQFSAAANSNQNLIDVLANDSIAPDTGETLRVTALGVPSQGGTVTIGTSGANVLYTPQAGFIGTETFTYTLSDGSLTATGTVTVNVGGPTVVNDSFTVLEDAASAEFNVLSNDSAANAGVTISVESVATPTNGTASVSSNGTRITYRPNTNFFGTDQFTYTVVDSNGAKATATVTFTVTGVNDAPPAPNDSVDVVRGSTQTQVIQVTDLRSLNVDGTTESLSITSVGETSNGGTVSIATGGVSVSYTPPSSTYVGSDSFTYTVADASGLTTTGTITIDVVDYTPLDFIIEIQPESIANQQFSSQWSATLTGVDFRGQSVNTVGTYDTATKRFAFSSQVPGEYEVEIPAMPFLFGNEQSQMVEFSSSATDTNVDPVELSLGNLHARFLSVRDFVNTAPDSYVFVAVEPGQSHVWMVATDNADTPENIVISLSADGTNLTIEIDDPSNANSRQSATVPVTNTQIVDDRGSAGEFRLFKVNVDQGIASIRSSFTTVTNPNAGEAEGEGVASAVPSSLAGTVSNPSQSFAASNMEAEGESSIYPVSKNGSSAAEISTSSEMSYDELGPSQSDRTLAVDVAMLEVLPQLQRRSSAEQAIAEGENQPSNVDDALTLLDSDRLI